MLRDTEGWELRYEVHVIRASHVLPTSCPTGFFGLSNKMQSSLALRLLPAGTWLLAHSVWTARLWVTSAVWRVSPLTFSVRLKFVTAIDFFLMSPNTLWLALLLGSHWDFWISVSAALKHDCLFHHPSIHPCIHSFNKHFYMSDTVLNAMDIAVSQRNKNSGS